MFKYFFSFLLFVCWNSSAQTSYVWNGSTSTAWNVPANWTPSGIPGTPDNVTIVTGANNCILHANTQITNLTVTSGLLDMGGFLLTSTGNLVFTSGSVSNGTLFTNAGTGNTANFSGTTLNANATLTTNIGAITISGGTYHGAVSMNQTGAVQTTGTGGATFNNSLFIQNSGTNNFRINGNCTFNGVTTFSNTGSGYFLPELNTGNTYNSALHLINTSASSLRMCYLGTTNFNGNIFVNNTGTGNIEFCEQATAVANLNSGNTISIGSVGFTQGRLNLRRFTQLGTTSQNLSLTGSSYISITNNCVFNGPLSTTAPSYILANSVYNMPVIYTKTGATSDATTGGNVYNSTLTVNHNGSTGYWSFGNGTADTYNDDVYSNNNSSERIIFGHNSTGNLFNGNIILTQIGSSQGTAITWNSGASATLASGKTVLIGSTGFNVGYLYLQGLTQLGSTPISLTLSGSTSIYLGPSSSFAANVSITAPDIYARGATYNSPVVFTKTGGTSNHNNGAQNIFNSTLSIDQQSNTGYFMLGYNSNDLFNDDITVTSTGSGGINLGWSSGTGNPTLASGKKILIGAGGFGNGYLRLGGFVQLGPTINNITLTGSSVFYVDKTAANCVFNGSLTITAPNMWIAGGTFNAPVSFIKTGGSSNHNNGVQNIFNSTLNIDQQSNGGYFMLGYNSNDLFNDDVTLTSSGTGGINLGWTAGTGNPTLASGKKILIGAGGFNAGYLRLGGFVQLGPTINNITLTGSSVFYINPTAANSIFNGSLTVTAPDLWIGGGTFNAPVSFIKTGGSSNHNQGFQNIFNSTLNIEQQSNGGYFMLSYNANDVYNDDITVSSTGSGGINFGWTNAVGSPTLVAGKTIFVGSAGFNAGYLAFNKFTQLGNAPVNLNFTGTSAALYFAYNSIFGGPITGTVPSVYFNGAVFNSSVTIEKNGPTHNASTGSNTFQAVASFTDSGAGYLLFGNGNPDVFNGDVKFTNSGSHLIYPAYNSAGNLFNGNIEVNSSGSALGITFCDIATSTATLASAKTISVGSTGYSAGYLILRRFTQLGNAPVTLPLSATASYLQFGPSSAFGGNVTSSSPGLFFNGCIFNGTTDCTKTGASGDYSSGGNTFHGVSKITNTGSSFLLLGNSNPDTWNSDVIFTNTGSERLLPCWATVGNIFNGDIYVNTGGSAQGIQFCGGNSTATATLAATKSVYSGTLGLNAGYLILKQFTQLGNAPINLTLNSTATYLQYGPLSVLGGNVTSQSPRLYFNGCTFNGVVNCIKNGTGNDASSGSNIFNATSSFTNSGSGYLLFGNGNSDVFNSSSFFHNTGSNHIYVSYNSTGNVFGGPVTFSNTPTSTLSWIYVNSYQTNNSTFNDNIVVSNVNGAGVYFGSNTGTSTLTAGKIISVGSGGFNSGQLIFRQFTQSGNTAQSFTTTGTSVIQYGPTSSFNGNLTTASPGLLFHGCTFNGVVNCAKNGSSNDASNGNNIFNAASSFTNSGSGYLLFGNGTLDQFNSSSSFHNLGSNHIYVAYNSTGNVFGGQITLNNSPTSSSSWIYVASYAANNATFNGNLVITNVNGAGVYFGSNSGTSTLSAGNSISIGAGGFNAGQLVFRQFTQSGSTAQNFTTTGTSLIQYGPTTTFNGVLNSASPGLFFTTSVFNNNITCYKTGTTNDNSAGGNTFNGISNFINNGTGHLLMTNSSADTYNSDVQFERNNTGQVYPNYNNNSLYFGNVTVKTGATYSITFGANNGIATFTGTSNQSINKTSGSENPIFTRLVIDKSSNDVTLNTKINVTNTLTLTSGLLNTTSANILNMNNNSVVGIGNALSYVNGPMNYDMAFNGTRTLNMPLGKGADWRPAILVAAHNSGTSYTYNSELFNSSAAALGWSYPPTLNLVSLVHYWDINRVLTSTGGPAPTANVAGNQTITLFYGANDGVTSPSTLRIAKNTSTATTSWIDIGGTGSAAGSGSITSTSSPSNFNSYSRITLANHISGNNPLPIELLSFNAVLNNRVVDLTWITSAEHNNSHFEIERSSNGLTFERIDTREAYGDGNSQIQQTYETNDSSPFNGVNYYRLKQVDKNGEYTYSSIVSINIIDQEISVYPNAFSNSLKIDIGESSVFSYKIFNNIGQLVKAGDHKQGKYEINTTELVPGVYHLNIESGQLNKTVKVIKY